jgi:RHS repeat-associated protein
MIRIPNKLSLALTPLLLLLASSDPACAWYDPGAQRWINRDPLGEKGHNKAMLAKDKHAADAFPNPYLFVRNRPGALVDPEGLKVWVCTVATSGFPFYGFGTHSYFWDDRPGTPQSKRECGKEGSLGYGGHSSDNIGPSSGDTGNPWRGSGAKGATTCYPVGGSEGKEQAVMDCCDKSSNRGIFFPYWNDCHSSVDDCLKSNGLSAPPHPRMNDFPPVEPPPEWPPAW